MCTLCLHHTRARAHTHTYPQAPVVRGTAAPVSYRQLPRHQSVHLHQRAGACLCRRPRRPCQRGAASHHRHRASTSCLDVRALVVPGVSGRVIRRLRWASSSVRTCTSMLCTRSRAALHHVCSSLGCCRCCCCCCRSNRFVGEHEVYRRPDFPRAFMQVPYGLATQVRSQSVCARAIYVYAFVVFPPPRLTSHVCTRRPDRTSRRAWSAGRSAASSVGAAVGRLCERVEEGGEPCVARVACGSRVRHCAAGVGMWCRWRDSRQRWPCRSVAPALTWLLCACVSVNPHHQARARCVGESAGACVGR